MEIKSTNAQMDGDFVMSKRAVMALSGGMDSTSLLLRLLREGYTVTSISYLYGQKHSIEVVRATENIRLLQSNGLKVEHKIIDLSSAMNSFHSALTDDDFDIPEGHYEEDQMKQTVVPNRNAIFSSILYGMGLSISQLEDTDVVIALGVHSGDHAIYPDCRQEFRDADYKAFCEGNWEASRVSYYTPYLDTDKYGILQDGESCCECLSLDFDMVYKRTNTSYKPVFIPHPWSDTGGGDWYSDYKSASSVERIEAFLKLGRPDPVVYADETGVVDYEVAKAHVEKLLAEHANKPNMNDTIDIVNNM